MTALSLYEINHLVRGTLEGVLSDSYWLKAEISEAHVNRGHLYLEFVQKDARGMNLIAKARGQVWAGKWAYLSPYFERTTGQRLSAGMQVLVRVQITFHEMYGYSLNVIDIDPTYTLGDIARKRQEILLQLKEEGIDTMNKELELPLLLQRIAVVTSPTAAGCGDFFNQLENNVRRLAFRTKLFPATMQGNDVERSIINALNSIVEEMDDWDVVVIIRGGGSSSDLSGFDTLALAENVAQFPLPIITGIGHERDDTVIDMVSHTRVKTPTAAAEFLIHHQEAQLDLIDELASRIKTATLDKLQGETNRIHLLTNKLPSLYAAFKEREVMNMNRLMMSIQFNITQRVAQQQSSLHLLSENVRQSAERLLSNQHHLLEMVQTKLDGASPDRILRLGFSITRVDGKAVTDVSRLSEGQTIETTILGGKLISEIRQISAQKNIDGI